MPSLNWDSVFPDIISRPPGASEATIQELVATICQPLTAAELEWLSPQQRDPERWILPSLELPAAYLDLLRWSDGGQFRNGSRLFQFMPSIDSKNGVRAMMLAYSVPFNCPGILPFAMNGGGIFYAFDMRFRARDGEYQIVVAECGHPHTPFAIAPTLLDACNGTVDVVSTWDDEDEITRPLCDECGEWLVCPDCGKRGPVKHP